MNCTFNKPVNTTKNIDLKIVVLFTTVILSISLANSFAQTGSNEDLSDGKSILFQNYPDPFNEVTRIEFQLDQDSFVKIFVTDKKGNEIQTLVSGEVEKGFHKVHFRYPEEGKRGFVICKMNVYLADTEVILFSDQKVMNFDNGLEYVHTK